MPERSRRAVLASLGATLSALAGCGGSSGSSSDGSGSTSTATATATPTPTPAARVEQAEPTVNGNTTVLDVRVADASVSTVAIRTANGTEVKRSSLGTGTAAQLEIGDLEAGSYDVVAVQDGEIVDQQTVDLTRSFEVTDVSLVKGSMRDKTFAVGFSVTVKSTGDLPVNPTNVYTQGDVPRPYEPDGASVDRFATVPPEQTRTLKTRGSLTTDDLTEADLSKSGCSGNKRSGTLVIKTDLSGSRNISVTYSLGGQPVQTVLATTACSQFKLHNWEVQ